MFDDVLGKRAARPMIWLIAAGLFAAGCGSDAGPRTTALAAGDGGAPVAAALQDDACTSTTTGSETRIRLSASSDCQKEGSCPLGPLTMNATAVTNSATGESSTTWAILRNGTTIGSKAVHVVNGSTTTDVVLGADLGIEATLHDDGTTVTGSVAGRSILPASHSSAQPELRFADGQDVPKASAVPGSLEQVAALFEKAGASLHSECSGSTNAGEATAGTRALGESFRLGSTPHAESLKHASPDVIAAVPLRTAQVLPPLLQTDSAGTPAPLGVPTVSPPNTTQQNNLLDFVTPECTSCEQTCAETQLVTAGCFIVSFFVPILAPACALSAIDLLCGQTCFAPGAGCGKKFCAPFPQVGTCDDNQSCCGSICCGAGSVCGNNSLGECCPSDHPVGCGDRTLVTCFKAGSTCCGNLPQACPAGQACAVNGTTATCCAPGHVSTSGQCCDQPTCGGQCCDQGSCVNGQCCFGPVVNGQCCPGGLQATVCNGQCCTGSCTSSGACCATTTGSTVCGSACCGPNQVCADATNSICAAPAQPTLKLLSSTNGTVVGQSGGPATELFIGQSIVVNGFAYDPGTVTLSWDSVGGQVITTTTASGSAGAATFSAPIVINVNSGSHQIVGWETTGSGTLQASVAVLVEVLP